MLNLYICQINMDYCHNMESKPIVIPLHGKAMD